MATTVLFKNGKSADLIQHEGKVSLLRDDDLVDTKGRGVSIQDNSSSAGIIYDLQSVQELKIHAEYGTSVYLRNQTRTGTELHLPNVISVAHRTSERVG